MAALDGKEAVELALRENGEVILLGVNMPNIDGIEACSMIREEEKPDLGRLS